jgi:hypothetical protein
MKDMGFTQRCLENSGLLGCDSVTNAATQRHSCSSIDIFSLQGNGAVQFVII